MLFRRLAVLRARTRRARHGDDGFTLLESVIALTVATIVFTAMGAALISSVQSVMVGRTNQQAADAAERAMEDARKLGYNELAIKDSTLVNEPSGITSSKKYVPDGHKSSGAGEEPLVTDPEGSVQHKQVVTVGRATYEVYTYVTRPVDVTAAGGTTYKRVTVVTRWTLPGSDGVAAVRTRSMSTLVSNKVSGLPLPDYKFTPLTATSDCANQGGELMYGFNLKNNGARDSWRITDENSDFSWTYYTSPEKTTQIGTSATPPSLGPIDPTGNMWVYAVATVAVNKAAGSDASRFRATSVATPTSSATIDVTSTVKLAGVPCELVTATPTATATATATATPTATSTAVPPAQPNPGNNCAGSPPSGSTSNNSTLRSYYLTNTVPNSADTTSTTPRGMAKQVVPNSTTLWNYSTDLHTGVAGRLLKAGGAGTAGTMEWRHQFSSATKFTGNGVTTLWAAPASGASNTPLVFTVKVLRYSSTGTLLATLDTETVGSGAWACAGFKKFGSTIAFGSGNGTSLSANDYIGVQVTVTGGDAVLAYDTTNYPAALVLPVKSGG